MMADNNQANEDISKYKLLTSYGGPGSVFHTTYGSVIISCIEEWGFIRLINEYIDKAQELPVHEEEYVKAEASHANILLSNDKRLLEELRVRKGLVNLKYLVTIPDIELNEIYNTISNGLTPLAINSTYMPKVFFNKNKLYRSYNEWYRIWGNDKTDFHPPKYKSSRDENDQASVHDLIQDNIVLICQNGHISDFPWSKYLNWRSSHPLDSNKVVDLFSQQDCCPNPRIYISEQFANASGFDGKWLKCTNPGCNKSVSLKGLMSLKVLCPGHKPWEATVGRHNNYFGDRNARIQLPPHESCNGQTMIVALTTGNNLYFSRILSSIYMPQSLFLDDHTLKILRLEKEKQQAIKDEQFLIAATLNNKIKELEQEREKAEPNGVLILNESDRDNSYKFQEYNALVNKDEIEINIDDDLIVKDVTSNLDQEIRPYFTKILRIDNLKITSIQLDFSRKVPIDSDAENLVPKNIFRSAPELVRTYPAIENFGEGIFFAFNNEMLSNFKNQQNRYNSMFHKERDRFAHGALNFATENGWRLYLLHTFSHLIMRELEFKCGYPTASLCERIYVSKDISDNGNIKMNGCLIYTAEGAEGSMGGVIAQTSTGNINTLIKSALKRATICNSDPLCWNSTGQGLFDLNLAACFSCALVSETSCELRNIYLDRLILVDPDYGFFKDIV